MRCFRSKRGKTTSWSYPRNYEILGNELQCKFLRIALTPDYNSQVSRGAVTFVNLSTCRKASHISSGLLTFQMCGWRSSQRKRIVHNYLGTWGKSNIASVGILAYKFWSWHLVERTHQSKQSVWPARPLTEKIQNTMIDFIVSLSPTFGRRFCLMRECPDRILL
jgi:hypothetical protein